DADFFSHRNKRYLKTLPSRPHSSIRIPVVEIASNQSLRPICSHQFSHHHRNTGANQFRVHWDCHGVESEKLNQNGISSTTNPTLTRKPAWGSFLVLNPFPIAGLSDSDAGNDTPTHRQKLRISPERCDNGIRTCKANSKATLR